MTNLAPYLFQAQLDAVIQDAASREIIPGEHDCCTFISKVIELQCGSNPIDFHGIHYEDFIEARRILGGNPLRFITDKLHEMGINVINPVKTRTGDIVAICGEGLQIGFAMGVVTKIGVATFLADSGGIRLVPIDRVTSAWRCKCPE